MPLRAVNMRGTRTSRHSELRGNQNFAALRTSWHQEPRHPPRTLSGTSPHASVHTRV